MHSNAVVGESPLRHKTRKITAKNWNKIVRTRELTLFKSRLL